MDLYRTQNFTGEKLREKHMSWNDIFEDIPVKISNSALVSSMMTEIDPEAPATQADFDWLVLSTNPFLEKNLEFLIECMDDLAMEQQLTNIEFILFRPDHFSTSARTENAARRAAGENPFAEEDPNNPIFKTLPEPSRLDSYLITNQISNYCSRVNGFSGQNMSKLYLMDAFHEKRF